MDFTKAQESAISSKGKNILVSAAAGSGKTTVLCERIKRGIEAGDYELSEIIVVSFNTESAADIRAKLLKNLSKAYSKSGDIRLFRQIMMLDKAVEAPEKSVEITKTETGYQAAISNYTGNAVIVAASYESTGALKSVAIGESKTIDGNGTLNVTFADAENVKIFIWESLQTGTPVFPA